MAKEAPPEPYIHDKDEAIITCRKVIIRLIEYKAQGEIPTFLKTYANTVLERSYNVLDEDVKFIARREE